MPRLRDVVEVLCGCCTVGTFKKGLFKRDERIFIDVRIIVGDAEGSKHTLSVVAEWHEILDLVLAIHFGDLSTRIVHTV